MQTSSERITEACFTVSYDINKLPSLGGEISRKSLNSRPSPGTGEPASKPETGEQYSSGRAFFKGGCPFWLKRKEAASPPQGQATPKSRLCMEATHESPIQAVRKPATRGEPRGPDPDEESVQGKRNTSLLRKLLCLKRPPTAPEASALQGARARCRPVAALSRTANPEGESPLRWKPREMGQRPAEASSVPETAGPDPVGRLVGWWVTKPWRAFRAMLRSRAKKRSVLPEDKRGSKLGEERGICLPAEPKTSPIARVGESPHFSATEDQTLASDVRETRSPQEEGEGDQLSSRCGLEIHGQPEDDILEPATEREVDELCTFLSEGRRFREEERQALRGVFKWRGACHPPGGNGVEAEDVAGQAPELGDDRYWAEVSDGEDQALGDLAENPGGQGMLMAMGDLSWLSSEFLGSPVAGMRGAKEKWGKDASAAASNPESQAVERENEGMSETEHILLTSCAVPTPAASQPGSSDALNPDLYDAPRAYLTEEEEAPFPGFPQPPMTPLELSASFSSRGKGLQEEPPPTRPCQALPEDGGRRGSCVQKPLSTTEEEEEEESVGEDKQRLYLAAVEIVGAAIDAAAEQLAKAAEREPGRLGSSGEVH